MSLVKDRNKWQATIQVNGKSRNLGRFTDEQEAARAYDHAAIEAWGNEAPLNFERMS